MDTLEHQPALDQVPPQLRRPSSDAPAIVRYRHQVAGHGSILRTKDGRLLKPAIPNEVSFYEKLDCNFPALQPFVPKTYGIVGEYNSLRESGTIDEHHPEKPVRNSYIVLEDIPRKFRRPCILDLKMGKQHFGPLASDAKKIRALQKSRNSTSHELGFRVSGIKIFHPAEGKFLEAGKEFSRQFTADNIADLFRIFFWDGHRIRIDIAAKFIEPIQKLREAIRLMLGLRFYSSSLLMCFEGAIASSISSGSLAQKIEAHGCSRVPLRKFSSQTDFTDTFGNVSPGTPPAIPQYRLHLIDFAKTYTIDDSSPDLDLLLGLDSICKALQQVVTRMHPPHSFSEDAMIVSMNTLVDAMHEVNQGPSVDDGVPESNPISESVLNDLAAIPRPSPFIRNASITHLAPSSEGGLALMALQLEHSK